MLRRALAALVIAGVGLPAGEGSPAHAADSVRFGNERETGTMVGQTYTKTIGPFDQVMEAATRAAVGACTGLTRDLIAAMMFPPTWPEVLSGDTSVTPSPLSLNRNDDDNGYWYWPGPDTRTGVFWHAAAGMWQMDDSGLGTNMASGRFRPYNAVADHVVTEYCDQSTQAALLSSAGMRSG